LRLIAAGGMIFENRMPALQPTRNLALVVTPLLGLYVLAAAARFIWLYVSGLPEPTQDAQEYLSLARTIASGGGFSLDGLTPHFYRPPLFSGMLAVWFLATNTSSQISAAMFLILANATAAPLTAVLGGSLGLRKPWALIGGMMTALYPYGFINIGLPLQEFIMAPAVTVAIWLISRFVARPSAALAVAAGVGMGAMALLKAPHLMLPWFLAGSTLIMRPPMTRATAMKSLGLMVLTAHLVVLPWTLRNYRASGGELILVNAQATGIWLWAACDGDCGELRDSLDAPSPAPYAPSQLGFFARGDSSAAAFVSVRNEEALRKGLTGSDLEKARRDAAREYLVAHPGRYALKLGKSALLTSAPAARPGVILAAYPLRMIVMAVVHVPLFFGLALGLLHGWRERRSFLFATCAYVVCYGAIHMATLTGEGRHVIPFLPFLTALCLAERLTGSGTRVAWGGASPE
jgi:hypothetical protein